MLGAPYELGGRGPGVFDCFGLVVWLLGVEIPPGRLRTELRALRAAFRELGQGERVLPGDVLGWESLPGRLREQHVALYEGPMVVEARAGAGVHRTSWSDALSERGTPCVYRRRGC